MTRTSTLHSSKTDLFMVNTEQLWWPINDVWYVSNFWEFVFTLNFLVGIWICLDSFQWFHPCHSLPTLRESLPNLSVSSDDRVLAFSIFTSSRFSLDSESLSKPAGCPRQWSVSARMQHKMNAIFMVIRSNSEWTDSPCQWNKENYYFLWSGVFHIFKTPFLPYFL